MKTFYVWRSVTKEEKDQIYQRVINERDSPTLLASETGHSIVTILEVLTSVDK
jgi:hypothetical protein